MLLTTILLLPSILSAIFAGIGILIEHNFHYSHADLLPVWFVPVCMSVCIISFMAYLILVVYEIGASGC